MAFKDGMQAWFSGADLNDSHGAHTLVAVGSPTHGDGPDGLGNALYTTQGGNYAKIANADASAFKPGTSDLTISFLFYNESSNPSGNGYISFGGNFSGSAAGYKISPKTDHIEVNIQDGSTQILFTTNAGSLVDGTWNSISVRFVRGGDCTAWINGANEGSADISSISASDIQPAEDLIVGANYGLSSSDSRLKNIVYWNRAITDAEIAQFHGTGDYLEYEDILEGVVDVHLPLDHASDIRGQVWADLGSIGTTAFVAGKVGDCLSLAGAGRLEGEHAVYRNIGDEAFSLDGWINPNAIGANMGIAGQTNNSYSLQLLSSGKIRFRINTTGGAVILDHSTVLSPPRS